jgi:hypothetical protein
LSSAEWKTLKPWGSRLSKRSHWDGVPIKPAITTFGVGPRVSDSMKIRGVRLRTCVRPGLGARIEDAAPRIVGEIDKGSRSAGQVLNLEGLGALDQLPRLREGSYSAFHSVILAGWMATPS